MITIQNIAYVDLSDLDTGQMNDTLRADTTITVRADASAMKAAAELERAHAATIVVTGNSGEICGVVFPNWIQQQVKAYLNDEPHSFKEAVMRLQADANLLDSDSDRNDYGHEWLNYERPVLFFCEEGNHFTDTDPCKYHP